MTDTLRRRLIAVLSADVAGYTGLMEADEVGTHTRLMRLDAAVVRPCIADRGGRIVKHTGDGFLAAFDSVLDAADCALSIQENTARAATTDGGAPLLFRMGLNLADAIVEPHDIFGEGVNLAARLQQSAEPGGLVVSAAAADQLRGRSGLEFADLGTLMLKNLQRVVRAFAVRSRLGTLLPAGVAQRPPDDRPSIAVLPFRLAPEDTEGAWFAEGVIEGIIHTLAGIDGLFVISRGTSLAYAGGTGDPRAIGQELGVRYMLTGSVRRAGSRLRILTELVEPATGSVIRSDRHEGAVTDLFDMQDRIAAEVVAAIAPSVRDRELQRAKRKHPDSMTGYDLVLQGLDVLYRLDRESFDRARGLLQQAMAYDPGYAPAYSHAATWHMFRIGQGWSQRRDDDVAEAARCAGAALQRDPSDAVALSIHGHMLSFTKREYQAARHFLDRAIAVGPNCHMAWALSSATAGYLCEGERAVQHAEQALRLSPRDPFAFFAEHMLSQAHYVAGDWTQAVTWGRRAAARNGLLTSNLRTLAAALVQGGAIEEARAVAHRMLAIDPTFSLTSFAAQSPMQPDQLHLHVPRLRAAGLPD